MGLSGSGKSTVVRCLSRLIEPSAGSVIIDGQELLQLNARELIEMRRHKMGMVFQNFGLLPHLSVLDNVAYPLRVQGMNRSESVRPRRAKWSSWSVWGDGRARSPRELSGGMQQRVGIARSLAVEPDIWFLDEPFSALDPLIRRQMQDEFLRLQDVLHKTIVFITHDFLEALRVADRIAILREGRLVQVDTPAPRGAQSGRRLRRGVHPAMCLAPRWSLRAASPSAPAPGSTPRMRSGPTPPSRSSCRSSPGAAHRSRCSTRTAG